MHYNIHMEDNVVKLYIEITRKEVMDIINHFHNLTMRINHRIISSDELLECDMDASLRILNRRQFQTSHSTSLAEFIIKIGSGEGTPLHYSHGTYKSSSGFFWLLYKFWKTDT